MNEDELLYHKITGLSHSNEPSAAGYGCPCEYRCGKQHFFERKISTILISFVDQCRLLLKEGHQDHSYYLVTDGEAF